MNRTLLRWSGYLAFAIVFAIACAFLSHWQFSRNAERSEQLALVAANYDADPVALSDLIGADGSLDPQDQWRPVEMTGTYLVDDTLLARNRPHGGTAAYEVLVPFQTDTGQLFLIDRGWLPPGDDQPDPDVVPAPASGTVTVVARLMPGEELRSDRQSAPDGQVPVINLPLVADTIGAPGMITGAYGIMVSEDPAADSVPQALESPSDDPGPYLSYAIQWILFAVMGFAFLWYMIRTELKVRREDAADAAAADDDDVSEVPSSASAPPRARRRRRGEARPKDRDMADEDALLDELTPR